MASPALAQSTGTIRGTVTDPSGAAIANASVFATETSTSISRDAASNDSGIFVFPNLPIGTYSLKISAPGFATQNRPGLTVITGQVIDLPIAMAVGAQTQQVTVTSETQQIETATSTVSQSVTQQQMRDLPLNGRNPLQLTSLTAGAVLTTVGTESTQQDNTGLSVNGLRSTENTYTLDGTIYLNRFFDSVPQMPNPDALQEFTIQASNYSAEHAGSGALVQLSTRSGTSELHGSAYEYFRNTVLNANNYFPSKNPVTGAIVKPPFKLNQFGGTVGGPIFVSKKAFFFFSAEDLQQRSSPNTGTFFVPTQAELSGDFSAFAAGSIHDPVTGAPYANNKITTPMDPLSAAINKQYLAASEATCTPSATQCKVVTNLNNNVDNTQYLMRFDQALGSNDHLSERYFYNQDNYQRPFTAPLGFFAANLFRNQALTISDAHVFSNTLTGALYLGAYRGARTQIPEAPGLKTLKDLGQTINYGSPNESIVAFPGVRANISTFVNVFSGGALTQDATTFDVIAQLVKVLHTHTLSFGGDIERDRVDMNDFSYTPGDNTFNGQRTGNVVADFYTGYESSFFEDNGRTAYLRELRPSLFLQDDWKIKPRLTLNLGMRWEPYLPPIDDNGTLVGFNLNNPSFQSTIAPNAPKGMWFGGDPGLQNSVYKKSWKDLAPRVGFAYNIFGNGKSVIRGGYGIFYGYPEGLLYQRTDAMQPVDLYLNITAPPQWDNVYSTFSGGDPFPRSHVGPSQFKNYSFILPLSGGVLNPSSKTEYTQNYNLVVEQDLSHSFAMSVAYVGNHAEHIMGSRQFNPAIYNPNDNPIDSLGNENSRRLFPGLATVELADAYEYAMTNSLQFNVTRRSSHGLTLLSNLVWMKTIDNTSSAAEGNAGPPNPFNLNSARGVADFDQAIRFTTSANYVLPHFNASNAAGFLVNGWQVNAIVTSQTGLPLTLTSGVDNSLSGIGNDYAVYNPGVSIKPPAGSPKTVWINRLAFSQNPLPQNNGNVQSFGNVPRNSLRGPGYEDTDISVFKEILPERRVHGQFQAQSYNAWNHTNFANPSTSNPNSASFGTITSTNQSTGTVNIPSQYGTQRVWQFALKIIF